MKTLFRWLIVGVGTLLVAGTAWGSPIEGPNDPAQPAAAVDDILVTAVNTALIFTGDDLLANDGQAPVEAGTVFIVDPPTKGALTQDGTVFHYAPTAWEVGLDSFTYTWRDPSTGLLVPAATVTIRIAARFQPLAGNWDADRAGELGTYVSALSRFVLCYDHRDALTCVERDAPAAHVGWTAVYGDWDGDGKTDVGVHDPGTGDIVRYRVTQEGTKIGELLPYDAYQWMPAGTTGVLEAVGGDFDGDGLATIALYDPAARRLYVNSQPPSGVVTYDFGVGSTEMLPIAGDWNALGTTTVGLYDPTDGTFYLSNANGALDTVGQQVGSVPTDRPLALRTEFGIAFQVGLLDPLINGPQIEIFEELTVGSVSALEVSNLAQIPPCPDGDPWPGGGASEE